MIENESTIQLLTSDPEIALNEFDLKGIDNCLPILPVGRMTRLHPLLHSLRFN